VVGIVEGSAVLVRQATRYALSEGVKLAGDDIVEAAPGSHVQIEFGDGVVVSLADGARVMLQPRWVQRRGPSGPIRVYVLGGWVKLSVPANVAVDAAAVWLSVGPSLAPVVPGNTKPERPATLVVRLLPPDYAVFVESGRFRLSDRVEAQRQATLGADDFVWRQGSNRLQQASKPSSDFVAGMPPLFRDALPARAGRFGDRVVPPRPLGEVAYADVAPWLRGEPALRVHLVDRWRGRSADPAFRAAVQASLSLHPEWEPVLFPQRQVEWAASRASQASR
jgi:hypothetical protein